MMKATTIAGGCLLFLLIPAAWAVRVYSWTDTAGITHFSETPPDDAPYGFTVRDLEPAPVAGIPAPDDYYSVVNQAARMEARRLEMERQRLDILRAEAQARQAEADAAAVREQAAGEDASRSDGYIPLYPWYPVYGPRPYQSHRYYPHHPNARPQRPGHNKKLILDPEKP